MIGPNLIIPGPQTQKDIAIRSLKDPGTAYDDPVLGQDPQPKHMKDYVYTLQDDGGVHINSGIPNHAFYLIATQLGGYAWQTVGPIWYQCLCSPQLSKSAGFRDFARLTLYMAQTMYPKLNSPVQAAIQQGWAQVGIYV